MNRINLVLFNEDYWNKGLIFTQNINPLKYLCEKTSVKFRIISFTSVFKLIQNYKKIRDLKKDLKEDGIQLINLPVFFYPTRYMILRKKMIPFFYFNVFLYIKILQLTDIDEVFFLRSYQISLGFLEFFRNKNKLIFDPRTDWIMENVNLGYFSYDGPSVRFWLKKEKSILTEFHKTYFISEEFREQALNRNKITYNSKKYRIQYNVADLNNFCLPNEKDIIRKDFLYTGSLGQWNDLTIYLDFFKKVSPFFQDSNLIICTSSDINKINMILDNNKYEEIKNKVFIYRNIDYSDLKNYYKTCKYGLQLMSKRDSRLGVKFIEYIASGIIPIVNENVVGAVSICKKFNIGVIIKNNETNEEIIHDLKSANSHNLGYVKFIQEIDVRNAYSDFYKDDYEED